MAVKDIRIYVLPATLAFSNSYDFVGFESGWVVALTESTDIRFAWSQFHPNVQRVEVSPAGIAYPGDAVPGNGQIKVTIDFAGAFTNIVMNRVENVTLDTGWAIITKGDHVIAFTAAKIFGIQTQPSDP